MEVTDEEVSEGIEEELVGEIALASFDHWKMPLVEEHALHQLVLGEVFGSDPA